MSVLRIPTDTSGINQGFGALGQAMSNLFDPRLRWQAYQLQQEILLKRLQMQELQRKFGARDDLKAAYMNDPQFRELYDRYPAIQSLINREIERDTPGVEILKMIGIERLAHGANTNPDIGAAIEATGAPYDKPYLPVTNEQRMGDMVREQISQKQAESAATERGKLIGGGVKLAPGEELKGPPGGAGSMFEPINPVWNPLTRQIDIGGGGPQPSPSSTGSPSSGSTATPTTSGGAGTGAGGGVTTISGPSQVDIERQKKVVADYMDDVGKTANLQEGATKLLNVIHQIQKLHAQAGTNDPITAQTQQFLVHEFGLALSPGATAQQATQALLTQTMPALIKQYNMTRFARPEIEFTEGAAGQAWMKPEVLNTILANYAAGAELDLQNANLANQIRAGGYNPNDMANYWATKNSNIAKIDALTNQIARDMGALTADTSKGVGGGGAAQGGGAVVGGGGPANAGSAAAAPPTDLGTAISNTASDIFHRLFGGGGAPPATAAPPTPEAQPTPIDTGQPPIAPEPIPPGGVQLTPRPDGTWGPLGR